MANKPSVCIVYDNSYVSGGEICAGQEKERYPDHEDTEYGETVAKYLILIIAMSAFATNLFCLFKLIYGI